MHAMHVIHQINTIQIGLLFVKSRAHEAAGQPKHAHTRNDCSPKKIEHTNARIQQKKNPSRLNRDFIQLIEP